MSYNSPSTFSPPTVTTTTPIIYITTPPPRARDPPSYFMTPPPTQRYPLSSPRPREPSPPAPPPPSYFPPSSPAPAIISNPNHPQCCSKIQVHMSSKCYEVQHTKMGVYSQLTNKLAYNRSNVSFPVYKQDHGDNYIFYFSHPSWSGWMVGPEVTNNRGGLIRETRDQCPTDQGSGQWQYYSPVKGFINGDVSVTCADWSNKGREDDAWASYHIHHHYHHEDINSIQEPAYSIKSKGDIIDARFVFPNTRPSPSRNNTTNPIPSLWNIVFRSFILEGLMVTKWGKFQIFAFNFFDMNTYYCQKCDYSINNKQNLERHVETVHQGLRHSCKSCDRTFTQKGSLAKHVQAEHEKIRYYCNSCDYQAKYNGELLKHNRKVHENIVEIAECELCNFKGSNNTTLKIHMESIHQGVKYCCSKCDKQFTQKTHLRTHFKSAHLQLKRDCPFCGKQFQIGSLKSHIKSVHEGIRYPCNHCNYQATQKSSLKNHIRSSHENNFVTCLKCDFKTKSKNSLYTHKKRVHESKLTFNCAECQFKTNSKSNLGEHIKRSHLDMKYVYYCSLCDYSSMDKLWTTKHMTSSHGVKQNIRKVLEKLNFKCSACEKSFSKKEHLKEHQEALHEGGLFPCTAHEGVSFTNNKTELWGM